jgi:anti-sigma factor RsiW
VKQPHEAWKVEAFVDGELDLAGQLEIEDRLPGDPALRRQVEELRVLREQVREHAEPPRRSAVLARPSRRPVAQCRCIGSRSDARGRAATRRAPRATQAVLPSAAALVRLAAARDVVRLRCGPRVGVNLALLQAGRTTD